MLLALLAPVLATGLATGLATPAAHASEPGSFFWANAWAAYPWGAGGRSGDARMDKMARLIRREAPGAGVLAELMPSQRQRFEHDLHGRYRLVVGTRTDLTNAVFYDPTAYRLVGTRHFRSYYFGGERVREPVAILEDLQSAARVAVVAVHNPADLFGRSNARWRSRALRAELAEVGRLRAAGLPVLMAGDFNNAETVRRRLLTRGLTPAATGRAVGIDQLFAAGPVQLSDYRAIRGPLVAAITNHRAVYTARFALETPSPVL